MAVWSRIKRLNFKQLFLLTWTFIKRPQYFFPTHRATLETVRVCNRLYGNAHHKNNVTNAFRHALWNVLIAKNCFAKNNSVQKSVDWAKKITELHENLAPNAEMQRNMDLHNNKVGRILFAEKRLQNKDQAGIVSVLKEKMETALKVSSIKEIEENKGDFVYIEDCESK